MGIQNFIELFVFRFSTFCIALYAYCSYTSNVASFNSRLLSSCAIKIPPQHSNKMDVAINLSIQLLLGKDDGQYDKVLFAMGERVTDNEAIEEEEILSKDSDDDSVVNECCPICSKTCNSPNKLAKEEIRRCQNLLKVSGTKHFLRDNSVASTNLEDYLYPSIWCWHPQRLLSSNLRPLLCWNESCTGHTGKNYVYYSRSY